MYLHQEGSTQTNGNGGSSLTFFTLTDFWSCIHTFNLQMQIFQNDPLGLLLLLLVWHAPLGVRSAKRRHQYPEWTILSRSYRLIQ